MARAIRAIDVSDPSAAAAAAAAPPRRGVLEVAAAAEPPHGGGVLMRVLDATGVYEGVVPDRTPEQIMQYCRVDDPAAQPSVDDADTVTAGKRRPSFDRTVGRPEEAARMSIQVVGQETLEIRVSVIDENEMIKHLFAPTQLRRVGGTGANELLHLSLYLLDEVARKNELVRLIQRNCDGWRESAKILESGWQREKDKVFHNFLKLYNGRKDLLRTALENVQRLESENDGLRADLVKAKQQRMQEARVSSIDDSLIPLDQPNFAEIERLAKGRRAGGKSDCRKRKNTRTKEPCEDKQSPHPDLQGDGLSIKGRRNRFTGAIEIDGDDIINDSELDQSLTTAQPVKRDPDQQDQHSPPSLLNQIGSAKSDPVTSQSKKIGSKSIDDFLAEMEEI